MINGQSLLTTPPSITVIAGAYSNTLSTVTASSSLVASGASSTLTVTVRDSNGNIVYDPANPLNVVFTFAGGGSTGNISTTTDNLDGTYTANFTGLAAGSASLVSATINGIPLQSAGFAIQVVPGATSYANSIITVGTSVLPSGNLTTFTLTTADSDGNRIHTGGSTVVFNISSGTSNGTLSAVNDNGDGTYTTQFIGTTAGTPVTVGALLNFSPITSTLPTVQVIPGAFSTTNSVVTVPLNYIASGSNLVALLTLKDAYGNLLTSGGETVVFNYSGGSSTGTFGTVSDNGNGTYSSTFTGVTAGTATSIVVKVNGSSILSAAPPVTVLPGPVSLSRSSSVVGSSTLASGSSTSIIFTASDANGNVLTTGGLSVTFQIASGSSTGIISPTTDNGNGTYTAQFTADASGTPAAIEALVGGNAVTSAFPTITVTPGTPSTTTSTITVSAASILSGATDTLTLTARDAYGNALTSGGALVAFSISGGTSTGTISSVSDNGNGTYTATFTGVTAGSATTINTTLNGVRSDQPLPTVTVLAGSYSASQSTVSISTNSLASGTAATVTLTIRDANDNPISSGVSPALTASGGTSTGSFSAISNVGAGQYTATFTGIHAGTATTIGATVGGVAVSSSLPLVTVIPGSPSLSNSVTTVGNSTVKSGSAVSVNVLVVDANGNPITTGVTVTLSNSGGTSTGTFQPLTNQSNGNYTSTFTGATAGTATQVIAAVNSSSLTSSAPTVRVLAGSASLSQSSVSLSSSTVSAGSSVSATLAARDSDGNMLTGGGLTVSFALSGGTSSGTFGATTDNGDGTYTATFSGVTSGSAAQVIGSIGGSALTSAAPSITVTPGNSSAANSTISLSGATVASGATITATLHSKDASGNNLTTGGLTVVFNRSGGTSTGNFSATTDNGDGTYTATFTGVLSGTSTTIGATINGTSVTSTLPTETVTPGAASVSHSVVSVGASTVASGSTTTVTLTAKDAAGNSLTSGGLSVAFSSSGGTSTDTIGAVTDNHNGTYTATLTALTAGTATTVGATISGNAVTSTLPTVTVTAGSYSLSQSAISVSSGAVASGSTVTVTLQAEDADGNNLTSGGLSIAFNHSGGTSSGNFSSVTDNGNGTYTATFTGVTSGTATSITATIGGAAVTSTSPTVIVTTGAPSLSLSTISSSSGTVASGSSVTLTVVVKMPTAIQLQALRLWRFPRFGWNRNWKYQRNN